MAKEHEMITSLWLRKTSLSIRIPDMTKPSRKSNWKIKTYSEKIYPNYNTNDTC